mmetsp:Transcript_6864/g.18578  ORF Transcript_6864/g.18578 Transcript_6864/m.18578 type:complete len:255 (-) Transcript_6864:2088-2852(-)
MVPESLGAPWRRRRRWGGSSHDLCSLPSTRLLPEAGWTRPRCTRPHCPTLRRPRCLPRPLWAEARASPAQHRHCHQSPAMARKACARSRRRTAPDLCPLTSGTSAWTPSPSHRPPPPRAPGARRCGPPPPPPRRTRPWGAPPAPRRRASWRRTRGLLLPARSRPPARPRPRPCGQRRPLWLQGAGAPPSLQSTAAHCHRSSHRLHRRRRLCMGQPCAPGVLRTPPPRAQNVPCPRAPGAARRPPPARPWPLRCP